MLVNQYPKLEFKDKSEDLKLNVRLKSMGVGIGDYNNDSYLDYHVTNIFGGPFLQTEEKGNLYNLRQILAQD